MMCRSLNRDGAFLLSFFFTWGGCVSCLHGCLGAMSSYFHSLIITAHTFRRAADHVGGQLRGDKECPFSGVTSSGRIWRKVSESDATVILTWRASKYKIHELHQRYVLKVCSYFWRFQTLLLLFGGYKRDYRLAIPNVIIFWQFQT